MSVARMDAATGGTLYPTTEEPENNSTVDEFDDSEQDVDLYPTVGPSDLEAPDFEAETEDEDETEDSELSDAEMKSKIDELDEQFAGNAAYEAGKQLGATMSIMGAVRMIGGGIIGLAVIVVVLNDVMSLASVENSTGPFSDVITSLEETGGAALGLLVIGFLVAAASRVMGFFGGGF